MTNKLDELKANVGTRIIAHVLAAHSTKSEQVQMLLGTPKRTFQFYDQLANTAIHQLVKNPQDARENLEFIRETIDYILGDQVELPLFDDPETNERFERMVTNYELIAKRQQEKKADKNGK